MDHTDNALRTAIKALEEVVKPAVDPGDAMAVQQLQLVIESLRFVGGRLDHLHDRARFDVRHHLALADAVGEDATAAAPAAARRLAAATAAARAALERADARTPELREAAAALAAALRDIIRESGGADGDVRARIERRIVTGTRERIQADRAWHLPQGFDPDPGGVPALPLALGAGSGAAPA